MQREHREVLFVRVPASLKVSVEELAVKESLSVNDVVTQALKRFKRNYDRQEQYATSSN